MSDAPMPARREVSKEYAVSQSVDVGTLLVSTITGIEQGLGFTGSSPYDVVATFLRCKPGK